MTFSINLNVLSTKFWVALLLKIYNKLKNVLDIQYLYTFNIF